MLQVKSLILRLGVVIYLACNILSGFSQGSKSTIREFMQNIKTYPYSDPNPVPLLTPLYPYFRYDGFTDKPVQKEWKVVELENDYIRVMILPEVGGKIWTAIEKSTGRPFIYYNHVVKFRDIAMRGPYTSGGLELNYGIIGHTPNCATPVDYIMEEKSDGSVSCIVGVLDLLTRTNWRLEINLQPDKAYFTTKTFWYNTTPVFQPYYHWLNGGYKSAGNLEFIFPGTHYIGHGGEHASWPVNDMNGKKISFYEENNFGGYKSYHVFGKYAGFSGGYWHDDHFGVVRFGNYDDKAGKKIWIWGLSRQGMIWEKLLTDTDGQYVEMQSGRLFNQNSGRSLYTPFKYVGFAPYATDIWTEYFYPVLRTDGYVEANQYGALNLITGKGSLKVYFSPAQSTDDLLEIREGERLLYSKKLVLNPLKTFSDSISFTGNDKELTVTLGGNKLVYRSDTDYRVISRPVEAPEDFNWNSAYGLYVEGREAMDQKLYTRAGEKLNAALLLDNNHVPSLIRMAELMLRNLRYDDALKFALKAISIDTHDGEANYFYALVNERLGKVTDAMDGFSIATLSSEFRSAAYTGLARLYLKEKDYIRSREYALRAVDYNRFNIEALQMQAVISRKTRYSQDAKAILETLKSFDPLNHFASFERYLVLGDDASKRGFISLIRNELPSETFMELALWYYNIGLHEDALKVLEMSPRTAEREYWLCFLKKRKLSSTELDPSFSFPFRWETAGVIEKLLETEDHWLLKYHLALIYRDRNRIEESSKLMISCGDIPDFAPFYVARYEMLKGTNDYQGLTDLKKALSLSSDWRYYQYLANFYLNNGKYEEAIAVSGSYFRTHPEDFRMGTVYARSLLLGKRYSEADEVLTKLNIIPVEGATGGREMYREAKLMQAADLIKKKNYRSALKFINQAALWPENLGVGKPYDEDIDNRLENWMEYLCLKSLGKDVEAASKLGQITAFTPRTENGVRNFLASNAVITAIAFEMQGKRNLAEEWMEGQIKEHPGNKLLEWSRAMFEKQQNVSLSDNEKDANSRIIIELVNSGNLR